MAGGVDCRACMAHDSAAWSDGTPGWGVLHSVILGPLVSCSAFVSVAEAPGVEPSPECSALEFEWASALLRLIVLVVAQMKLC